MSLLNSGESLVKFVANKVKGFEVRRIDAVSGIYVTDVNGYIGIKINDYFSQNGSPYPGNYALVARGPDYSSMGLGRVTFLEYESHVIGGKSYRCVTMPDGKVWMAENLDYVPEGITLRTNSNPWVRNDWSQAQCAYYNYDETTYGWEGKKYGIIYNGNAALALTIAGWHIPTDSDWDALCTACGGAGNCGKKLKSTTDWNNSGNGEDNWGFNVYPGGYNYGSQFYDLGDGIKFWSANRIGTDQRMYTFSSYSDRVGTTQDSYINGCYIRLVKDPDPSEAGA